jgi:anti-anti-sigma factor
MEKTVSLAPGTPSAASARRRQRAHFSRCSIGSSIELVTVGGEIDAANALSLGKFVEEDLDSTSRLIVDLRGLSFFGTQGFSILHRINVMCSRYAVNWVVIPGAEVDRVLRICDPDACLLVADTLNEAITAATRPPRSHLRLVSGAS